MRLAPESPNRSHFEIEPRLLELISDALPETAMRLKIPMVRDQSPEFVADALTIALSRNGPLTKSYRKGANGLWTKVASAPRVWEWSYADIHLPTFDRLLVALYVLNQLDLTCLIRAAIHPEFHLYRALPRRWHESARKQNGDCQTGPFIDLPRTWLPVDIDDVPLPSALSYSDPDEIIRWIACEVLPEPFCDRTCVWQFSGSAGLKTANGASSADRLVKLHLFFRASEPVSCRAYHALLNAKKFRMIDRACAVGVQPIYTAAPSLDGGDDPLNCRQGIYYGVSDTVDLSDELKRLDQSRPKSARPKRTKKVSKRDVGSEQAKRHVVTPAFMVPYDKAWLRILYNEMGCHADGYRHPIFCMVSAAIRNGERNFDTLKSELRFEVQSRFRELGDDHKSEDVAHYLSNEALDEAIENSLTYWTEYK